MSALLQAGNLSKRFGGARGAPPLGTWAAERASNAARDNAGYG
jgi:hypothetical protein